MSEINQEEVVRGVGRGRRGQVRGRGRGRERNHNEFEEIDILTQIRAERQITKKRVATLSPATRKELSIKKQKAQLCRVLLPDAPPRKRHTRKPSPEREPCVMVELSLEPMAGPSMEPVATTSSSEPMAGPSWASVASTSAWEPLPLEGLEGPSREPVLEPARPAEDFFIEFIDQFEDHKNIEGMPIEIGAEIVVANESTKSAIIGIHDKNFSKTVEDWIHMDDSDDDVGLNETEVMTTQTERNAMTEPACTSDLTAYQLQVLTDEDRRNDDALRCIAPSDAYDFPWTRDVTNFKAMRETFTGTPGPTFTMTDETSIFDIFYKMFDSDFIVMLVNETNRYAEQRIDKLKTENRLTTTSRFHRWSPTNVDEMISFLALLLLQGLYPLPEEEGYFSYNGYGTMPYFRKIMSYNRFVLLKTMLHFVNNETTTKNSKLYKILPVLDYFNHKFSSLYYPAQEIAVDESLLKWHGRLNFAQKIKSKAAKVGIKSYELCESSSGYLWSFKVYAGKDESRTETNDPDRDTQPDNIPERLAADDRIGRPDNATALIVFDLMEPLLHKGHTLIMDNFYNSPLLARCLKKHQTDCFGTLRVNREFLPDSLKTLNKTDLRLGEVMASYCSDLSVMVWRDANLVSMISTYHPLRIGTREKYNKLTYKPDIVLDYNKSMGGIDKKDQLLSAHHIERLKNQVWYKKLFRRLFNTAVLNCYLIYKTRHPTMSQRTFRTQLAEGLLRKHKDLDLITTTLTLNNTKRQKERSCMVEDDHFPMRTGTRKTRCWMCSQQKIDRRTSWKCMQCKVNLCIEDCFRAYHKRPLTID